MLQTFLQRKEKIRSNKMRNLTLLTDLYQLTMMYGYFKKGVHKTEAVFDLFFRKPAGDSTYAIVAGLEQVMDYIDNIKFTEDDIEYFKSLGLFDEEFYEYLRNLSFTGEIYAMPEGTVAFPNEPLVRVRAEVAQAQLIETAMLTMINHQTLIATKASRVAMAAEGEAVLEFGLRRAQGPDAGIYGARAAVIGGCSSTSNVLAGKMFDVAISGTHAHSWIMSFPSEIDAFRAYAEVYPDGCLLLVDTYDTLKSGVPNAIKVFKELRAAGHEPLGIRLDSGDLAYLSIEARKMLDEAGFENAKICASSDLDEQIIRDLHHQGAKIDIWGVGTKLITSENCPSLGGVYKLSAREVDGKLEPKIKISENVWKITNPGYKKVVRIYSRKHEKALADLIMLNDETIDETKELTIFDPNQTWKRTTLTDFYVKDLLVPVFVDGKRVYESPNVKEIQEYCKKDMDTFWIEYKRFSRPHLYKVDLSDGLYDLRQKLLRSEDK